MTQVGTQGWARVAAVVAASFSGLAVIAGTRVLTGVDTPDYVVLPWLVRYNVAAGLGGVAVAAGLWLIRPWAVTGAVALAAMHGSVLVSLLSLWAGGSAVANDSLVAMTLRTVVWSVVTVVVWRATGPRRSR
jgi:hypothetical protein